MRGFKLVLKIALGVFLGLAAWTYRADLGSLFLLLVFFAISISIIVWLFKSISVFLEKKKLIQSAKELTTEIVKLGLVDSNLENALFYGLQVQIEYEGFNTLSNHLKKYKTSLKNSEDDEYEKMQIVELVNEAINDFKIHRSISEV